MKILKTFEKVFFGVAIALIVLAMTLSGLIDESESIAGLLTVSIGLMPLSVVLFLAIFLVGAFLFYSNNKIARLIGGPTVGAYFVILFSVTLEAMETSISLLLAFIATIVYAVAMVLFAVHCFIVYIRKDTKKLAKHDPDNDEKVQLIIKWKDLLERGVVTEEEYELKRKAILELNEEILVEPVRE